MKDAPTDHGARTVLSHPTRHAIARACAVSPRTVGDLSSLLGKADGALRSTVGNLVRVGVLEETRSSPRGARTYSLSESWRAALDTVDTGPPGMLGSGQELIIVHADGLLSVAELLSEPGAGVAWAARSNDSTVGVVLAFQAGTAPGVCDALMVRLAAKGARCWRISIDQVMSRDALKRYIAALLPPPSLELAQET